MRFIELLKKNVVLFNCPTGRVLERKNLNTAEHTLALVEVPTGAVFYVYAQAEVETRDVEEGVLTATQVVRVLTTEGRPLRLSVLYRDPGMPEPSEALLKSLWDTAMAMEAESQHRITDMLRRVFPNIDPVTPTRWLIQLELVAPMRRGQVLREEDKAELMARIDQGVAALLPNLGIDDFKPTSIEPIEITCVDGGDA